MSELQDKRSQAGIVGNVIFYILKTMTSSSVEQHSRFLYIWKHSDILGRNSNHWSYRKYKFSLLLKSHWLPHGKHFHNNDDNLALPSKKLYFKTLTILSQHSGLVRQPSSFTSWLHVHHSSLLCVWEMSWISVGGWHMPCIRRRSQGQPTIAPAKGAVEDFSLRREKLFHNP